MKHEYSPEFLAYMSRECGGRTGWETPDRIMCVLGVATAAATLILVIGFLF